MSEQTRAGRTCPGRPLVAALQVGDLVVATTREMGPGGSVWTPVSGRCGCELLVGEGTPALQVLQLVARSSAWTRALRTTVETSRDSAWVHQALPVRWLPVDGDDAVRGALR